MVVAPVAFIAELLVEDTGAMQRTSGVRLWLGQLEARVSVTLSETTFRPSRLRCLWQGRRQDSGWLAAGQACQLPAGC